MFRRREPKSIWHRTREFVWPRAGWRRTSRYFWHRVSRIKGSPHAIALGFACGAFASVTPLVGFHFLLSFFLAWILRANMLASAFGTIIGNPLTFPLFWLATYDIGRMVLGMEPQSNVPNPGEGIHDWSLNAIHTLWPIWSPMLVGAVPLGLLIASACYFVVKPGVRAFQNRRRKRLIERAANANEIEAA